MKTTFTFVLALILCLAVNAQNQDKYLIRDELRPVHPSSQTTPCTPIPPQTCDIEESPKEDLLLSENFLLQQPQDFAPISEDMTHLIEQANVLRETSLALKAAANTRSIHEKALMLQEAFLMDQEYLEARLILAQHQYQHTQQRFYRNRELVLRLSENMSDTALIEEALERLYEADYLFRLGKEIREEASAQPGQAASLAEMSNAEEKELLALQHQQTSLKVLKKRRSSAFLASN